MKSLFLLFLLVLSSHGISQVQDVVNGSHTPGFHSYKNFIKNTSCLANTGNITTSGSGAVTRTTTAPLEPSASCQVAGSSSGDKVIFGTKTFDNSLKLQNCELRFTYSGDGSKWKVYAQSNSIAVSPELQLENTYNDSISDYRPQDVSITFPCGDLSNSTAPVFEATSSTPANIKIAKMHIGSPTSLSPAQAMSQQSTEIQQTANFTNAVITGAATTSRGSGAYTYNSSTGIYTFLQTSNVSASISLTTSTAASPLAEIRRNSTVVAESSVQNSSSYKATATFNGIVNAGETIAFLNNSSNQSTAHKISLSAVAVTSSNTLSASCGANCVDVFSAQVNGVGGVSNENLDFINGNCTNANPSVCTFRTGIFTVAPNCTVSGTGGNNTTIAGATTSTTLTITSITDGGALANTNYAVTCQKQGADFTASRTIVGSFKEVSTVPGINKPKKCVVTIGGSGSLTSPTVCSSSPCTEYFDGCGTASTTWISAGKTLTTFAAGTFANSTPVMCGASASNGSDDFRYDQSMNVISTSTGSVSYAHTTLISTTPTNSYKTIWCEGHSP